MKENGGWRLYSKGTELQLGAWSVRQDGESLIIVIDDFEFTGDQAVELRAVRDQ
jgi:hypothetical protein